MAKLFRKMDGLPSEFRGCAVTVGNFDGVHRGHAKLIENLVAEARESDVASVVLTFSPPPAAILFPEQPVPPVLSTLERRAELLGKLGVDAMIAYPTDHTLLSLSPDEFFLQKLRGELNAAAMVEGPNFRFGKDREGNVALLRILCQQHGMRLTVVEAVQQQAGDMVSSSRIREAISRGDVESANDMLIEPYEISGRVGQGAQRGRELGFPTANLEAIPTLTPSFGVYAGYVVLDGQRHVAAIHIGPNPTFSDSRQKTEVHLVDWSGSLYGQELKVKIVQRIREVRTFESVAALREQLHTDIQACRRISQESHPSDAKISG